MLTWQERYLEELLRWRETPYSDSTAVCGKGINCLRFACHILDWLHGFNPDELPPVPRLPRQTAVHNQEKAMEVVRFVCRRYPNRVMFKAGRNDPTKIEIEPADVVVTQISDDHPSHILVAGPEPYTLWHSYNSTGRDGWGGVDKTGLGWCLQQGIYRIWRPRAVPTWT